MPSLRHQELPSLPLLLAATPPALEQILAQEGVPFRKLASDANSTLDSGKFVLFDGQSASWRSIRSLLSSEHVAIDIDILRRSFGSRDPFAELLDTEAVQKVWTVAGYHLMERVSRVDKAAVRNQVLDWIREEVSGRGGIWARLAEYPHPYRSAFNFRADLDEPYPDDYLAFARARRPIDDCSTHFVSTAAYGDDPEVLENLRRVDTQSHGHFHVIYRSETANRRNLSRARALLQSRGFAPEGFAAPEGRWNPGLDRVVEELGYLYSSDFALGYDDIPFYPWLGDRFSKVLQVPVHPICEGLFLDAGCDDPRVISEHLIATFHAKVASGEPAFLYGHPERRLGRFPEVVSALANAVAQVDRIWRVSLGQFARWWKWRALRNWSLVPRAAGQFEVRFSDWDELYPLRLEIIRGDQVASVALRDQAQVVELECLTFEKRPERFASATPRTVSSIPSWRTAVKAALDWETVTPCDELPELSLRDRLKKRLRKMRSTNRAVAGRSSR